MVCSGISESKVDEHGMVGTPMEHRRVTKVHNADSLEALSRMERLGATPLG